MLIYFINDNNYEYWDRYKESTCTKNKTAIKSTEMKLKTNYFKPKKQMRNPTNQSIYKREKDEHIKYASCRSEKVYFQKIIFLNR